METLQPRGLDRQDGEMHCYQSGILQIWLNTPAVANFIADFHVPESCVLGSLNQCMRCALKTFFDVYRGAEGRTPSTVNEAFAAFREVVANLWENAGSSKDKLKSSDQQDSAEFLQWMIQTVFEELSNEK